jgi:hypothetical protein
MKRGVPCDDEWVEGTSPFATAMPQQSDKSVLLICIFFIAIHSPNFQFNLLISGYFNFHHAHVSSHRSGA